MKFLYKLEQFQWFSIEEIKKAQFQKLREILDHAYENVPYYREIFNKLEINPQNINALEDFRKLPLLSKEKIIENFSKIIAKNYKRKDLIPNSTSGSTGVNLKFFKDRKTSNYTNAINLRHTRWTGWDIGDKHIQLWGSHYDISKQQKFYRRLKNIFINRTLFLSSYDMTKENMLEYRNKINKYKPKLITGYASALYLFSRFLYENNLDVYSPRGIISSAETLYENQRKTIESIFGCKVFNSYGCREVGSIANECREQNGLHIDAEHIIIEVLDEKGNPCKPGKMGEIVVTDLDNYAFPFIRYKIGDLGVLKERKCPCGRGLPLFEKIVGRVWDVIVGANGNRLIGTFWLIKDIEGIKQFLVLQKKLGEIILNLVVDKSFTREEKQKLIKRIYLKCGENMKVDIQLVNKIPLTKSGKRRFIISKVSPFV